MLLPDDRRRRQRTLRAALVPYKKQRYDVTNTASCSVSPNSCKFVLFSASDGEKSHCFGLQRNQVCSDQEDSLQDRERGSVLCHPASTATQFSQDSATSETKLLSDDDERSVVTSRVTCPPTAPPIFEEDELHYTQFHANGDCHYSRASGSRGAEFARSVSEYTTQSQCPTCSGSVAPNCPPPTYEEHHGHRPFMPQTH